MIEQQELAAHQHRQRFMAGIAPTVEAVRLTPPPEGGHLNRLYEVLQEAYTGRRPNKSTYAGGERTRTAYILDNERNWTNARSMLQDAKSLNVPIFNSAGETDGTTPLDRLHAPTRTPEDIVQSHEGFEVLIAGLSDQDKRMVRMYYRDKYTHKEVGEALGIVEGSASQRMRKIIKELRG